ncbi:hypothetical protein Tco_1354500 [Tanacetum coccineum]
MSDWKPQCLRRKRHFKWSLILSRTPRASRLSLSLHMSHKSLCSSSGILSIRVEGVNFTNVSDDDTTLAFLIKLEGDFVDLHLNDIEDMLLVAVRHKLFHLTDSDIVDFIVAFHMFTRSLAIKKCVKDLQLGVESYQKKLNITPPQQTFREIEFKELYTPSHNLPGVIYEDLTKQKRVMRADELYKFSDGTLKKVQDELHHRICDFHLEYNMEMPRRK